MQNHPLIFFFYLANNPWKEIHAIARGMRVAPGPGEVYGRYFLSLWYELPDRARTQAALIQLDAIERGLLHEAHFSGKFWHIHVTPTRITFTSHQFETWNTGGYNVFAFHELRHAILAWDAFLALPEEPPGTEYSFPMPDAPDTAPILHRYNREDTTV